MAIIAQTPVMSRRAKCAMTIIGPFYAILKLCLLTKNALLYDHKRITYQRQVRMDQPAQVSEHNHYFQLTFSDSIKSCSTR